MDMRLPNTFSFFPVSGKRPLVNWGEYSKRLPTQDEKTSWNKQGHKQWGIATGPVSKILVLDDDGGLDVKKYPIPRTWTVKTPRGGTHYYFRYSDDLQNKVTTTTGVLPKVDVRGQGGFVVFYGWQQPYYTLPLANPPKWLVDLLPNKNNGDFEHITGTNPHLQKSQLQEMLDAIQPGNRNDSFTRIAGSLRGRGYSVPDMVGILSPKAREVGFGLDELRIICESVGRYKPNEAERIDETQASSIEDFLKDQEKVEWICEGLIAKKGIGFIAGLPETMKTFIAIDLAVSASSGTAWLSKFPTEKTKVLYVDQERFRGETQRRFKALISGKELNAKDIKESLFVRCGSTTRLNLQPSFEAFKKQMNETRPGLVIIDSLATIHTSEENNRQSIQEVLEKIKELRTEFNCTFIFLSHENKVAFDKEAGEPSIGQMAGSIAIPAAAECVFTVRRQDLETSMVYQTKNTLAPSVPPFLVKVEDLEVDRSKISVRGY